MSLRDELLAATTDDARADVLDAALVTVNAVLAVVSAIPTVDPEDSSTIWNDGGVLKVASAGA